MEGLSPLHLILVLVVAVLVLGPGKLPEVGAALGKSMREFRRSMTDEPEPALLVAPAAPPPALLVAPAAPPPAVPRAPGPTIVPGAVSAISAEPSAADPGSAAREP
jgi:sec-independent protein translocase protein TatA